VAAVSLPHPNGDVTEVDLQVWVKERLRSTKMPGVVAFRDELPYSPTGKLLRRVLRDELSDAAT
jgi:acyl-CoA synthetase (AMP-forming)/AMP-acid ligase II